jgi:hypothetical protein
MALNSMDLIEFNGSANSSELGKNATIIHGQARAFTKFAQECEINSQAINCILLISICPFL